MHYGSVMRACLIALLFGSYLPAANASLIDYQLTFNAITGPGGTGSFRYDATPGAEWMSDIALDFGPGLTATVITDYDTSVLGVHHEDRILFGIFSDGIPFAGFYQWLGVVNSADFPDLVGVTSVIESQGISRIDFARNGVVYPFVPWNVIDSLSLVGPFYAFQRAGVADEYFYGTISLARAIPSPGSLLLILSALAGVSLKRLIHRRRA